MFFLERAVADQNPDVLSAQQSLPPLPANAPVAVQAGAVTPSDLLRYALDSGADLDRLEKLMDLQMRYEADHARKAFADDMARFKAKPIEIMKDKRVGYETDNGGFVGYMHASIGNVVDVIVPTLAEFGFSHRWDMDQREGLVIVTCVITHKLGHSQSTTLKASPDQSGKKNAIQSIISAKTYLERHTLLAATGLATKDAEDDDGQGAGITQEERKELRGVARDMRQRATPAEVAGRGKQAPAADAQLLETARAAADAGLTAFGKFWKEATPAQRGSLRNEVPDLEKRVAVAEKGAPK